MQSSSFVARSLFSQDITFKLLQIMLMSALWKYIKNLNYSTLLLVSFVLLKIAIYHLSTSNFPSLSEVCKWSAEKGANRKAKCQLTYNTKWLLFRITLQQASDLVSRHHRRRFNESAQLSKSKWKLFYFSFCFNHQYFPISNRKQPDNANHKYVTAPINRYQLPLKYHFRQITTGEDSIHLHNYRKASRNCLTLAFAFTINIFKYPIENNQRMLINKYNCPKQSILATTIQKD